MTIATKPLAGRTVIMSGGSRGIGLEIARRAAADGANITLIAKTDAPHPRLPGTIHTVAAELEKAGGTVPKFVGDVRVDEQVELAVQQTVERFGGDEMIANSRTPDIMADAAYLVLMSPATEITGNFFIDDEVLASKGVTDFDTYRVIPGGNELQLDLFLDA
jgi:NAD(P)-dependent dehydrogenase (short-subunit alcohol dehydrogenase family)